ncbi:ExbD/TolR family protein [Synechococcus sp. MIT S1220]|uniref:ExbD/TolR family protein n=1 Tax=Synechococcus sp. MIT S1220 TaxID=3082549 RepID=UPI0039AF29F7
MDFGNEFDQENDLTINILPMIDVLFAILLFFVLSSLILSSNRVVEINRPKATTTTTIGSDDVIVSIKKDGELFINSEPSNQTTLLNDLSIITQQNASKKLLIDAEQTIEYGVIFSIIEKAKLAEFESIGLVTSPQTKARK